MTRRLRTDRMRERARHVYAAAALRDSIAELAEKVAHGEVSQNAARVAMGFPPIRQLRGDGIRSAEEVRARLDGLSPAARLWLEPTPPSLIESFLDHELTEPVAKRAHLPWSRWTTQQNLLAFAVFIGLALIPLLVGLFAH